MLGVWQNSGPLVLQGIDCLFWVYDHARAEDFLPTIQDSKVESIWVVLIPPSSPQLSKPFGVNYSFWMKHLSSLQKTYPKIRGIVIDDFNSDSFRRNIENFRFWQLPGIIEIFRSPELPIIPVVYQSLLLEGSQDFSEFVDYCERYKISFPVIIAPWVKYVTSVGMAKSILTVKEAFPTSRVYSLVYCAKTSWFPFAPPKHTLRAMFRIASEYADGVVLYCPNQKTIEWLNLN